MRSEEEIRDMLETAKEMLSMAVESQDRTAWNYFKGWVDALDWVLGKTIIKIEIRDELRGEEVEER